MSIRHFTFYPFLTARHARCQDRHCAWNMKPTTMPICAGLDSASECMAPWQSSAGTSGTLSADPGLYSLASDLPSSASFSCDGPLASSAAVFLFIATEFFDHCPLKEHWHLCKGNVWLQAHTIKLKMMEIRLLEHLQCDGPVKWQICCIETGKKAWEKAFSTASPTICDFIKIPIFVNSMHKSNYFAFRFQYPGKSPIFAYD